MVTSTGKTTSVDANEKRELLKTMLRIRKLELAWGDAYLNEEIDGIPPSLSTGQEAISAGSCAVLEEGDYVFTTHRGQGPQIALGLDPKRIMAELYCRRTGYNKGKSYHVTDASRGVIGMGGIVPAQVPVAGGMALAQKMRKTDRVSLAFLGDGATNEGAFHETVNLAVMWEMPLIIICENNGYCITQRDTDAIKATSIAARTAAYGLPGVLIDGNDPLEVRAAMVEALARARAGKGPSFIEAKTARLSGHLVHDPQVYRPAEELREAWENCPIKRFRARLEEENIIGPDDFARLEAQIDAEVEAAVAFARESPFPQPSEAFEDLWADEEISHV